MVFVSPESCSEGEEYYSPSRLACLSCGANQTTAGDGKFEMSSGIKCTCNCLYCTMVLVSMVTNPNRY